MAGDSRVTDEMVERALEVWFEGPKEDWHRDDRLTAKWFRDMRRTLEAALSASPPAQMGVPKIAQIAMSGAGDDKHVVALDADGCLWERRLYGPGSWSRFPTLPASVSAAGEGTKA